MTSLGGAVIVAALFWYGLLDDWIGMFSSPLDLCGYKRTPDVFPCLAHLFIWLALRMTVIVILGCFVSYPVFRNVRSANLPIILLFGAAIGIAGGVMMQLFWTDYFIGGLKMSFSQEMSYYWWSLVQPHNPWAAATGVLISGGLGVAMAGAFGVIVGGRALGFRSS